MCEDNFFSVEFNTSEILRQRLNETANAKLEDFVWMETMGKKNKTSFAQCEAHKIQQEPLRVIILKNFYKLEKNI